MKRLIFILLALVSLSAMGQRIYTHTFYSPSDTDTTYYIKFWSENQWGMSCDFSDFDDTDATLDLGESANTVDGSVFNGLPHDSLPYTLADSTVAFYGDSYNFIYLAIKITAGSVTAGSEMVCTITRKDPIQFVAYVDPISIGILLAEEAKRFEGLLALK